MKIRLNYTDTGFERIENVIHYEFDHNTHQLKIWYYVGRDLYIKYIFARELKEYTIIEEDS